VVTVELKDVNPPEAVKDSFNEVNRAIQEKQTSINEARREWNKEIPGALGQAEQMVEAAEGYKTRRVNEARGDVARFQALRDQYARAKHVTRTRLYLETIEEVLPQVSQIFVVDGAGGGPLQLLDLKAAGARRVERAAEDEPAAVEPPSSRSSGGRR
jgi:membrane protease subunit HflK